MTGPLVDIGVNLTNKSLLADLDGVLALDRALDRDAIISRGAFEARPELFRRLVDDA